MNGGDTDASHIAVCNLLLDDRRGMGGAHEGDGASVRGGQTQSQATRFVKPDAVLLGDKTIEPSVDRDTAGSVKAFRFVDQTDGTARSISIYVASHSRAGTLLVGLYSNKGGNPGLASGVRHVARPEISRWNKITIKSTAVKAGQHYWVALLSKGGTLYFRDRSKGVCTSENAPATRPTALRCQRASAGVECLSDLGIREWPARGSARAAPAASA